MALSDFEAKYQNAIINLIKNQEAIIQGYAGNHIALVNQRLEAEALITKAKSFPYTPQSRYPFFISISPQTGRRLLDLLKKK